MGLSKTDALALPTWEFWRLLKSANKAEVMRSQSMVQAIAMGMGNYEERTQKNIVAGWDKVLERDKFKPSIDKRKIQKQMNALAKLGIKMPKRLEKLA